MTAPLLSVEAAGVYSPGKIECLNRSRFLVPMPGRFGLSAQKASEVGQAEPPRFRAFCRFANSSPSTRPGLWWRRLRHTLKNMNMQRGLKQHLKSLHLTKASTLQAFWHIAIIASFYLNLKKFNYNVHSRHWTTLRNGHDKSHLKWRPFQQSRYHCLAAEAWNIQGEERILSPTTGPNWLVAAW